MQSLVILMELSENAHEISFKAGNMCLNRFCIDEDAAFEISGLHYLKEMRVLEVPEIRSYGMKYFFKGKLKGKGTHHANNENYNLSSIPYRL